MFEIPDVLDDELLEDLRYASYRNFHAKGVDYVCLKRTPGHTIKAYFFDCDVDRLPEVVVPHDHRYDFDTTVISGLVANVKYNCRPHGTLRGGETYERFEFFTPLNGGDGFTWAETVDLRKSFDRTFKRGDRWCSLHDDIHTLRIASDQTIIVLNQYGDKVGAGNPTSAFKRGKQTPSLDGLYDEMPMDHMLALHRLLEDRMAKCPPPRTLIC